MIHKMIKEYIPHNLEKIQDMTKTVETPFLVIDLNMIKAKFLELQTLFGKAKIYYAVKASPASEILALLNQLGSYFDIASVYELNQLLSLNVHPDKMSYGNTIKKVTDIQYAHKCGVTLYSCDSEEDLRNIAIHSPGSKIFFRLATDGLGADWPLSRKFGCHQDKVYHLAILAKELGLIPYGVNFHVGSQQRDIGQWDEGIAKCNYLFRALKDVGIELQSINLGGGLPAHYYEETSPLEDYAREINRYLQEDFGDNIPEIVIEPGRVLAADAGTIVTEVILITRKSNYDLTRWVYVDIGKFSGLIETIDELIKYPIFTEKLKDGSETSGVILAGPTCDSMDILYERFKYEMPETLASGDKLYIGTTGAYTQSYSAVCFNGFPPLRTVFIDVKD